MSSIQDSSDEGSAVRKLFHKCCNALKLVFVFCGSAVLYKGVQPLLDSVVRLLLQQASQGVCVCLRLASLSMPGDEALRKRPAKVTAGQHASAASKHVSARLCSLTNDSAGRVTGLGPAEKHYAGVTV